jgi:chorismate--pyruvate lyase
MWLDARALNCYEGDASRRSWLLTPGLLTQRIREAAGEGFSMRVLQETAAGSEHIREIEMGAEGVPWLFAQTRVPRSTLESHDWLSRIGKQTLGEALATREDISRAPFRYALLTADAGVVARALQRAALPPQPLWVRHSAFTAGGAPFDLYEVFLPQMGRASS